MTIQDVKERVEKIAAMRDDPEAAHSEEDALYAELLASAGLGTPETIEHMQELAAEALRTKDMDFPRWCA